MSTTANRTRRCLAGLSLSALALLGTACAAPGDSKPSPSSSKPTIEWSQLFSQPSPVPSGQTPSPSPLREKTADQLGLSVVSVDYNGHPLYCVVAANQTEQPGPGGPGLDCDWQRWAQESRPQSTTSPTPAPSN